MKGMRRIGLAVVFLIGLSVVRGDVYRWDTGELICDTEVEPGADFWGWNLMYADFAGADLTEAYFTDDDLSQADFSRSNCSYADFYSSTLQGANFTNANLTYAGFSDVDLTDTLFDGAIIKGTLFDGQIRPSLSAAQLYSTRSYQEKDLSGLSLYNMDLSGWDFSGQNLFRAIFSSTSLAGADFTGANISFVVFWETSGFTKQQLVSTSSYQNHSLQSILLPHMDLSGCDLSHQNLQNTSFENTNLHETMFTGASIRYANFSSTTYSGFTAEQLYSTASYAERDLTGLDLSSNHLQGWNFRGQNLQDSNFEFSYLLDADFTDAQIQGSKLSRSFSIEQLYSTRSYKEKDLRGVWFIDHDLRGVDLSYQNLEEAVFFDADLRGADFTQAHINRCGFGGIDSDQNLTSEQLYSTASYQQKDLRGVSFSAMNLDQWDFSGQDLRDSAFGGCRFENADFTDADIRGATFYFPLNMGFHDRFRKEQLYSTASYKNHDLTGISLEKHDLDGWDLSHQNLSHASLSRSSLDNTNFEGANLQDVVLMPSRTAIFDKADIRGRYLSGMDFFIEHKDDMIGSDGHVRGGLGLEGGEVMRIWDDTGEEAIPIVVEDGLRVASEAVLRMVFEDGQWGSLITFEAGIDAELGGTLELLVDREADPASLMGTTFRVFDWTGANRVGEFEAIAWGEGYRWDVSRLYTTGEVTLVPEPGTVGLLAGGWWLLGRRRRRKG